MAEKVLI